MYIYCIYILHIIIISKYCQQSSPFKGFFKSSWVQHGLKKYWIALHCIALQCTALNCTMVFPTLLCHPLILYTQHYRSQLHRSRWIMGDLENGH